MAGLGEGALSVGIWGHLPLAEMNISLLSLVGVKGDLSLLEICFFVPGVLIKWKS